MKEINIGVLGLGVVGAAVVENLLKNAKNIKEKSGLSINVKGCDLRKVKVACPVTRNYQEIINDPSISIVVETIGGVNPAKKYVLAALNSKKHVVTSNKELIALHIEELSAAAQKNGVSLLFEGAVGGGIPIIAALRDNLPQNEIIEVYGIVNGTTNYILSKMTDDKKELSVALKEAQVLGYAEADPRKDLEGIDASYKAAILADVAFGGYVNWAEIYHEGITKIALEDINYAREIGYTIKLLAIAKADGQQVDVRVHPVLVPKGHPLANVSENFNAIFVNGRPVGELMFYGQGAGGDATSSAVIADIIKLAARQSEAGCGLVRLVRKKVKKIEEIKSRYYIRLQAPDRCGVLAEIALVFAKNNVSIAAVTQKENVGKKATIVILLHEVQEKRLQKALKEISRRATIEKIGNVIRIL